MQINKWYVTNLIFDSAEIKMILIFEIVARGVLSYVKSYSFLFPGYCSCKCKTKSTIELSN